LEFPWRIGCDFDLTHGSMLHGRTEGKENIYPPSFQAKLMLEEMPSTLASGMGSLIKRTDNQNINWKLDMNKGLGS